MKFSFSGTAAEWLAFKQSLGVDAISTKQVEAHWSTLPPEEGNTSPNRARTYTKAPKPKPVIGKDLHLPGPAGWHGPVGATGAAAPWGEEAAASDESNPTGGGMPVPEGAHTGEIDLNNLPACSEERIQQCFEHFGEMLSIWLTNWKETIEIEEEIDEAVRDEDGKLIITDKAKGTVKMQKVMRTRTVPAPQPDRVGLLRGLGSGRWPLPFFHLTARFGSLQGLIATCLQPDPAVRDEASLDEVAEIAGTMVQVAHDAFPDLVGTFDYSNKWREAAKRKAS